MTPIPRWVLMAMFVSSVVGAFYLARDLWGLR